MSPTRDASLGPPESKPWLWYIGMHLGQQGGDMVTPFYGLYSVDWRHAEYERLEEEIRHVVDLEERLRICREAERILVEEVPIVILLYPRVHFLVKPWVTRLPLAPTGVPWWWKDVVIEPH